MKTVKGQCNCRLKCPALCPLISFIYGLFISLNFHNFGIRMFLLNYFINNLERFLIKLTIRKLTFR